MFFTIGGVGVPAVRRTLSSSGRPRAENPQRLAFGDLTEVSRAAVHAKNNIPQSELSRVSALLRRVMVRGSATLISLWFYASKRRATSVRYLGDLEKKNHLHIVDIGDYTKTSKRFQWIPLYSVVMLVIRINRRSIS